MSALDQSQRTSASRGWRAGGVLAALALVVALAVAAVLSGFASSSPDGLESVAERQGFADRAQESEAIGPFGGYASDGDDSRLGTGVAGIAGTVTVLVIMGGAAWMVRRRGAPTEDQTV